MMVRNWMQANPTVIPSDMLVSEAKRILSENNLHALPVVDDGRLRGLVTRANLLRMGSFVLRTQNADEFNFFVNRLPNLVLMIIQGPLLWGHDDAPLWTLLRTWWRTAGPLGRS